MAALVYTIVGLQTVMSEVNTAMEAGDWATAVKHVARGNLILTGLPASAQSDTQTFSMRQDLKAAADLILTARAMAVDNRRLIRVGVRQQTSFEGKHRPPSQGEFLR